MSKIIENIILFGAIGAIIYFFFIRSDDSQKAVKKAHQGTMVKDLFLYKEITKEGLVILPGHQYRRMFEVIPTNLTLKSPEEEAMVWDEWRKTIDSVPVPMTLISQSRIMEMSDYIDEMERKALKIHGETNEKMAAHSNRVVQEFREIYQEQGRRERKYFVILRIDGQEFANESVGTLGTDSVAGAAIVGKMGKKQKYTEEEIRNISVGELDNAAALLSNGLARCGATAKQLNKMGVLDYVNNALNRDIAGAHSVSRMNNAGVFNVTPVSLTVDQYFTQAIMDSILEMEEQNIFSEPEMYPDEESIHIIEEEATAVDIKFAVNE